MYEFSITVHIMRMFHVERNFDSKFYFTYESTINTTTTILVAVAEQHTTE